jgi:hypothetical protein
MQQTPKCAFHQAAHRRFLRWLKEELLETRKRYADLSMAAKTAFKATFLERCAGKA